METPLERKHEKEADRQATNLEIWKEGLARQLQKTKYEIKILNKRLADKEHINPNQRKVDIKRRKKLKEFRNEVQRKLDLLDNNPKTK
jgi:hypothetical protein